MEFKFNEGQRVRVANQFYGHLHGRTAVVTSQLEFGGNNEYAVEMDGPESSEIDVWILKEVDLESMAS